MKNEKLSKELLTQFANLKERGWVNLDKPEQIVYQDIKAQIQQNQPDLLDNGGEKLKALLGNIPEPKAEKSAALGREKSRGG